VVRLAVCVLVSLVIISLLINTISVESLFTFLTTTMTVSQTLSERVTSTSAYPVTQSITERSVTSYPAYPITQNITEKLTSPYPIGGGVTQTINEYVLTRYNTTTIPYNLTHTINETLPARAYTTVSSPPPSPVTSLPTYTITNPYRSGMTCNAVNPTRISDTLYQYNASGLFYILVNNTNSVSVTIYPNNYGSYQQVCEPLYESTK